MNETGEPDVFPIESLRDSGVLWAINRFLFHPMGFALALMVDDEGKVEGWFLQGDGGECWTFSNEDDDDCFARFHSFVDQYRRETR